MKVFLFPGQGSQYPGMLKKIIQYYDEFAEIFKCAYNITGINIKNLCCNSSTSELKCTENTQLSMLLMDLAFNKILANRNILPNIVIGHSLGEYAALVSCGALTLEKAIYIVHIRAKLMARVKEKGCLATVIGLSLSDILDVCSLYSSEGTLSVALINTPSQIVIGGDCALVDKAILDLKKRGALKIVKLSVSAAFHTNHMNEMQKMFANEINKLEINEPLCDIILNCSAERTRDVDKIKNDLIQQCTHTVLWSDCLRSILDITPLTICEVGPGRVLTGITRNINSKYRCYTLEDPKQFYNFLKITGT